MSTATFIGYDLVTSGHWMTAGQQRGTAGYWLEDTGYTVVESRPAYVPALSATAFSTDASGPVAPRLDRPGGGAALSGRYYDSVTRALSVPATDAAQHYLSIYCVDDVGRGRLQTITILDGAGSPLASHAITYDFSGGVWVCFLVSGAIQVQFSLQGATVNYVWCGLTWDETEPARATIGTGGTAYTFAPSGGADLGGAATALAALAFDPAGGSDLGGSSAPATASAFAPSGGVDLGGAASLGSSTFTFDPSGGVDLGGSATPAAAYVFAPTAGSEFGGAAEVVGSAVYVFSPSGGVGLGGSAPAAASLTFVPSGGVALGGESRAGYLAIPYAPGPWRSFSRRIGLGSSWRALR